MKRSLSAISLQFSVLLFGVFWWLWSFTQTDPNLYYSSNPEWVHFQQFMWQINRPTVVTWYVVMIVFAFLLYFYTLKTITEWAQPACRQAGMTIPLFTAGCLLLAISNNALSHDIYNYMFNAKAVALYSQDPHVRSALEIAPQDEWVRFMHNVHTAAPYGHFWTYLTLLPYIGGMGKFISTYLAFKLYMAVGLGLLVWIQWKMLTEKSKIIWFLINPLVLIETLSSGHNDVWMMVFAIASFALLLRTKKIISWQALMSLGLLILSAQIKEATLVLIPLWIVLVSTLVMPRFLGLDAFSKYLASARAHWAEFAVVLMCIPLFTARSQQFNPWYLIWPLTFLPFVRTKFVRIGLVIFSLTSLLRYVPLLFVGGYSDAVQLQMRVITWSALVLTAGWLVIDRMKTKHV